MLTTGNVTHVPTDAGNHMAEQPLGRTAMRMVRATSGCEGVVTARTAVILTSNTAGTSVGVDRLRIPRYTFIRTSGCMVQNYELRPVIFQCNHLLIVLLLLLIERMFYNTGTGTDTVIVVVAAVVVILMLLTLCRCPWW